MKRNSHSDSLQCLTLLDHLISSFRFSGDVKPVIQQLIDSTVTAIDIGTVFPVISYCLLNKFNCGSHFTFSSHHPLGLHCVAKFGECLGCVGSCSLLNVSHPSICDSLINQSSPVNQSITVA